MHIIDTKDGLVMIDTGYPDMYDQILDSMNELELNPADICAIFHSHGHIDHFGCTQKFKELSGAKTYISRIDNDIVNGKLDLSWASELGYDRLPPFDCDVLVEDGEKFSFGDVVVRCRLTPGHTDSNGVVSMQNYILDLATPLEISVSDGQKVFVWEGTPYKTKGTIMRPLVAPICK